VQLVCHGSGRPVRWLADARDGFLTGCYAVPGTAVGLRGVAVSGRLFGKAPHAAERVPVVTVTLVVYDRGPEPAWHADRGLYGPWLRYEAEPADYAAVSEFGGSPWEAVHRLVSIHRGLLERRWSAWT
jgi:hypothetical protein